MCIFYLSNYFISLIILLPKSLSFICMVVSCTSFSVSLLFLRQNICHFLNSDFVSCIFSRFISFKSFVYLCMCVCLCTCECKCVCMQIQLILFLSNLVYFFLYFVQLLWQWFFKYCAKWKQLDWASVFRDQSEKFCDVSSLTTMLNVILFIHLFCEGTFLIPNLRFSVYFIVWLWILTHKYLLSLKALNSRYFLFQNMWHSGVKVPGDLSS